MEYVGEGYSIGPGYDVQGRMVFDVIDHGESFLLLIREDKEYTLEPETRRRENAVELTQGQMRELFSSWLVKRLGLQ